MLFGLDFEADTESWDPIEEAACITSIEQELQAIIEL